MGYDIPADHHESLPTQKESEKQVKYVVTDHGLQTALMCIRHEANIASQNLEHVIMMVPTGKRRDKLTEAKIFLINAHRLINEASMMDNGT